MKLPLFNRRYFVVFALGLGLVLLIISHFGVPVTLGHNKESTARGCERAVNGDKLLSIKKVYLYVDTVRNIDCLAGEGHCSSAKTAELPELLHPEGIKLAISDFFKKRASVFEAHYGANAPKCRLPEIVIIPTMKNYFDLENYTATDGDVLLLNTSIKQASISNTEVFFVYINGRRDYKIIPNVFGGPWLVTQQDSATDWAREMFIFTSGHLSSLYRPISNPLAK